MFAAVFICVWLNAIQAYPRWPSFSFEGTAPLFKFGAFVAVSDLLWVAYNKVDIAIAGKFFDVAELGFYAVALQLGTLLMTRVMPLFNVVAFPALAKLNDSAGGSNEYLLIGLRMCSMLVFPVFFGVAFIGNNIIPILLGDEWVEIVGMFAVLSLSVPFRVLAYVVSPAILAAGAAKVNMSNSFAMLVATTVLVILFMPMGLMGLAFAWSAASVVIFGLAYVRGSKVLAIPLRAMLIAMMQPLLTALLMVLSLEILSFDRVGIPSLNVFLDVLVGGLLYLAYSWFLFRERSRELIRTVTRLAGRA